MRCVPNIKFLKSRLFINLGIDYLIGNILPPWKLWDARKNQQKNLCKFYSLSYNYNIEAIEHGYFYSTPPNNFNDIADCNPELLSFQNISNEYIDYATKIGFGIIENEQVEKIASDTQRDLYNQCSGVTCFSHHKNIISHLMWSHYANKHEGICMQFNDIQPQQEPLKGSSQFLLPVTYIRKNPVLNEKNISFLFPFIKLNCWNYEKEFRLVKMKQLSLTDNERKISFNKRKVSAIYLGCRFDYIDNQNILKIISKHYSDISIYQMKLQRKSFKLKAVPVSLSMRENKYIILDKN